MIPQAIEANELLIEAQISGWTLEVMTTNWLGYWILQLGQGGQRPLALLINVDNLVAICQSMRSCIDAASNPEDNPRVSSMLIMAASDLPTQSNDKGAVSIVSDWSAEPVMVVNYYRGGRGEGNVIRQTLALTDAMSLFDLLATVYNQFPEKRSWKPLA